MTTLSETRIVVTVTRPTGAGDTPEDVARDIEQALDHDRFGDVTIEVLPDDATVPGRDFSGRTTYDYQTVDQSKGPAIIAVCSVPARPGDILEVNLATGHTTFHGRYLPADNGIDDIGEVWEAIAEWCGSTIKNQTSGPGDEPESVIPVGLDLAGEGDWIVRHPIRLEGGPAPGYRVAHAWPGPLPERRLVTDKQRRFLTREAASEAERTDTAEELFDRLISLLQREGFLRPFDAEMLLLPTQPGLVHEGDTVTFATSPPHWYIAVMVQAFVQYWESEGSGASNYVETGFRGSWARGESTEHEYRVILCRPGRPTPHDLRQQAEALVQDLISEGDHLAARVERFTGTDAARDVLAWDVVAQRGRPTLAIEPEDDEEVLPPSEWQKRTGITVMKPDGWTGEFKVGVTTFQPISLRQPITVEEFELRAAQSTCRMPPSPEEKALWERQVPCSDPACDVCHGTGEYATGEGYTRAWVPHLIDPLEEAAPGGES